MKPRSFLFILILSLVLAGCVRRSFTYHSSSRASDNPRLELIFDAASPEQGRWRAEPDAFQKNTLAIESKFDNGAVHVRHARPDRFERVEDGYRLASEVGALELREDPEGAAQSGVMELRVNPNLKEHYPGIAGELSQTDLLTLIFADVDAAYLDMLTENGFQPTWEEVTRLRSRGVTADFVQAMRKARSTPPPSLEPPPAKDEPPRPKEIPIQEPMAFNVDDIIHMSQRGVDADYVEAMQARGYPFDARELAYLKQRGISPEFAGDWRRIGYELSHEQLYYLRSRGLDADFARRFHEAGLWPNPEQLYYLRSRGIQADYAKAWRDMGYEPSYEDLYYLRRHGVEPGFARRLREAGYDLSPRELYYMKSHGIDADYAESLMQPELAPLTPEQLYKLKSRGVDAQMVKRLRAPAAP